MFYVRQTMSHVFLGISWISPFACLSRGLDSVVLENPLLYATNIGYALAYSFVFMFLSVYIMSKKGVKA